MALNFPAKVYQILENESTDIIRWHENEMAFRIVDHDRFEREIIPKYFRHNQISSVQRQLNLYGFKCISRGEDKGAFFHPKFKRGDWDTVRKITRFVPPKRTLGDSIRIPGINEHRKGPSHDEDYVFSDGAYHNSNAMVPLEDNVFSERNGYQDPDAFALFQPAALSDGSESAQWPYHETSKKTVDSFVKDKSSSPFVPPAFNPSSLTSRLGYKFPTVEQVLSASRGAQQAPVKEFIIIRNNVVKINPDYDLDDAINCTYDLDVGRHSIGDALQQQPLPPIPQNAKLHSDISTQLPRPDCAVAVEASPRPQRRSISMDDLAELCAEFAE